MKIAFMTFACPDWSWDQVVGKAAELGYDGVEPRMDANHSHGVEVALDADERARVRRQAEDAGIAICCLATSLQFIKVDEDARATLLDEAKARIELAHDLGTPGLRVFGGPVPEGVTPADSQKAAAENLRAAGEVALAAGVELWLETHDTFSRAALAGNVIQQADHPAVHANYDVMHPFRNGESLETSFAALEGHIRHCHWHDSLADPKQVAITRFGEGELPLQDILAGLRAQGFNGYLSGEWFNDQLGATPDESLQHYVTATRDLLAAGIGKATRDGFGDETGV